MSNDEDKEVWDTVMQIAGLVIYAEFVDEQENIKDEK